MRRSTWRGGIAALAVGRSFLSTRFIASTRLSKTALLAAVEDGTICLVGATTENPSFEVNAALLSRCRVVVLEPLTTDELMAVISRALGDADRGLAGSKPRLTPDLVAKVAGWSGGDARVALTTVEEAVAATPPAEDGTRTVDETTLVEARAGPGTLTTGREKIITT